MLSVAISSNFESGVQQDAQEFFCDLLEKLDKASVTPRSSLDEPSSTEEGGIAKEIFGGRLKSQVKTCKLIFPLLVITMISDALLLHDFPFCFLLSCVAQSATVAQINPNLFWILAWKLTWWRV